MNFTPGIGNVNYGGGYQSGGNSGLLQMLQELLAQKIAPQSFGTNGYQVPRNSNQIGQITRDGMYHPYVV